MSAFFVLCLFVGFITGCAAGNCRQNRDAAQQKNPNPILEEEKMKKVSTAMDRIKVYKYDGSKQCGMGQAISVEEMQKELRGIQVYSAENKPDGLMHIQMCGANTGIANVYEIDKKDLAEAKKRGFKEWTFN